MRIWKNWLLGKLRHDFLVKWPYFTRFGTSILVVAIVVVFAYLALPCLFKNIDCGDKGQCQNEFNDYSCSCGDGAIKNNETDPQSICIIDHCYQVDCERGQCRVSSNDYSCECESG